MNTANQPDNEAKTWLSYVAVVVLGFLGPSLLGPRPASALKPNPIAENASAKIVSPAASSALALAAKDQPVSSLDTRREPFKDAPAPGREFNSVK